MKMLRRLLLTLTISLLATAARAQTHYVPHIWVGAHAGMTLSEVSFAPSVRQKFVEGTTFGFSFRYEEERHVGVMGELNISQRGWKENFEDAPFAYKRQLTYIELPLMTHIFFGGRHVKCVINLGPEFGYMISDKITADFDYANPGAIAGFPSKRRTEQLAMDIKNRFDYGITGGAGVEWIVGRRNSMTLEARYYFGLGNIFPSSKKDTFNASRGTSILITLAYQFRLK